MAFHRPGMVLPGADEHTFGGQQEHDDAHPQPGPPEGASTLHCIVVAVNMSEESAAAIGTTLRRTVRDIANRAHSLAPGLSSHVEIIMGPPHRHDLAGIRDYTDDPARNGPTSRTLPGPRPPAESPNQSVRIDMPDRQIYIDGESIRLTATEFALARYLLLHHKRTVSRRELIQHIWSGKSYEPATRAIDVHIRRIRIKFGRLAFLIHSGRGTGYQFVVQPGLPCRGNQTS